LSFRSSSLFLTCFFSDWLNLLRPLANSLVGTSLYMHFNPSSLYPQIIEHLVHVGVGLEFVHVFLCLLRNLLQLLYYRSRVTYHRNQEYPAIPDGRLKLVAFFKTKSLFNASRNSDLRSTTHRYNTWLWRYRRRASCDCRIPRRTSTSFGSSFHRSGAFSYHTGHFAQPMGTVSRHSALSLSRPGSICHPGSSHFS